MRAVSFVLQVLIATVAFFSLLMYSNSGLIYFMLAQLAMGIVQLFIALVHTIRRDYKYPLNTKINIYWLLVVVYLAIYIPALMYADLWFHLWFHFGFIVVAWAIAFYFMFISYKLISKKPEQRDKFLPNLDFNA